MRRREFLRCLGGIAATWPLAADAQQTTSRTIGWFSLRSADTDTEKSILTAFRQGLSQTGYVEGRNLTIEFGFADGQYDRLPSLAADLVRRRVEVLVTAGGTNITRVAQAATTTIPIIFATANDPVQDGLVKSINRPGGNSTGAFVLNTVLLPKRFELLRQLLPNARLVGFLVNPNSATAADQIRHAQSAGRTMALELLVLNAAAPTEIDAAFGSLVQHGVDGLVMGSDPFFQEFGRIRSSRLPRATVSRRFTSGPSSSGPAVWLPTRPTVSRYFARWGFTSAAFLTEQGQPTFRSCSRPSSNSLLM